MKNCVSVGLNVCEEIDNVITLINSTSDVYDGTISFIYFNALNMEPSIYFNTLEESFLTEKEEEKIQKNFVKFKEFKFNDTIKKDIEDSIKYVREEALKKGYISKIGDYYFVDKHDFFTADFILKTIYKNKRMKLKEEEEENE